MYYIFPTSIIRLENSFISIMHYREQYAFVRIQKIQHEKYLDIPVWYV